jgi:ZIP family zinc transporter
MAALNPVLLAFLATLVNWAATGLGAAGVFLTRQPSRQLMDGMLGFAAGVMVSASFWSLLAPAAEMAAASGLPAWVPMATGFLTGALVLRLIDRLLPHLHPGFANEEAEGIKTSWRRTTLITIAITIHNLPEGLVVGVAIAAASLGTEAMNLAGAIALAIGIGIQNIPEGFAVAVPLRREGLSRGKSFAYGLLSAVVEPVGGVLGATFVMASRGLLPYALSFAAGAMIFVVMEDLVPEAHREGNGDIAAMGAIAGFLVMMVLDVALG